MKTVIDAIGEMPETVERGPPTIWSKLEQSDVVCHRMSFADSIYGKQNGNIT